MHVNDGLPLLDIFKVKKSPIPSCLRTIICRFVYVREAKTMFTNSEVANLLFTFCIKSTDHPPHTRFIAASNPLSC